MRFSTCSTRRCCALHADHVQLKTDSATDLIVRQITIAPGGSTGWHYHSGTLLGIVQKGTLNRSPIHAR